MKALNKQLVTQKKIPSVSRKSQLRYSTFITPQQLLPRQLKFSPTSDINNTIYLPRTCAIIPQTPNKMYP